MAKFHTIIFVLISSLMLIADAQTLSGQTERIAQFRVYVHDVLSGPNATVYEVARANITSTSPTSFGLVVVADDLMTAGPDPNSQTLGRSQGFVAYTGLEQTAITTTGVFVFTAGQYNGSTLSIVGRKVVAVNITQELSVVGGTGIFRFARGYTVSSAYSYDPVRNIFVWIYDTYVKYGA